MTRAQSTAQTQPRRWPRALGLLSAAALLGATGTAQAQVDVFPPLDNVMLLVDTSGSMEFQVDGSSVTCNPGNTAQTNDRSRWTNVVEALTGSIRNFSCEELDRSGDEFKTGEYAFAGQPTYDYKYPITFHRPLSGGCGVRPGTLPSPNAFVYPTSPITLKDFSTQAACTFNQDSDGILDSFGSGLRFGLMTFDTLTNPGTGYNGTSPDLTTGIAGTWSYIVGSSTQGAAAECALTDQEVGARNGAAPPWEGRMVNFGNPDRGAQSNLAKRQQIDEILRSSRPFGATPIAGMLQDAENFFFSDDSDDEDPSPAAASLKYGPKDDPYITNGCRHQFMILLTDGQPNLDLRPECEGDTSCPASDPDCKCPFDKPEDIALRMAQGSGRTSVPVFVIGFALESFTYGAGTVTCSTLDTATACADSSALSNRPLQACCALQRIAESGKDSSDTSATSGKAIFADTPAALRAALSAVLSKHLPNSSRTQPVLSTAGSGVAGMQRFYSSFEPIEFEPWRGHLERERFCCTSDPNCPDAVDNNLPPEPFAIQPDDAQGDLFEENLNSGQGPGRKFYTFIGGRTSSDPIDSRATMRPYVTSGTDPDGLGDYGARVAYGTIDPGTLFSDAVPAAAMEMPDTSCPFTVADQCRDYYLKWLIGLDNGSGYQRCETPGDRDKCHLLGDILHSTPRVVNRPFATLRDETYTKYASSWALRPGMVYTSSTDGFLHAFKTLSNDPVTDDTDEKKTLTKANNELWAFIPPATLPLIHSSFPYTHQLLLDGAPVVKDVAALIDDNGKITFERTVDTAKAGSGTWRTVLVQSFGAEQSGYFAVDITDPVPNDDDPSDLSEGGPRMLWQLTRDKAGDNLFGKGGVTPLITTLFFDSGSGASEVPVAVLPGGIGDTGTNGAGNLGCAVTDPDDFTTAPIAPAFPPRDHVKCYGTTYKAAHSLTIVRLDNGQLVRTFRRTDTEVHTAIKQKGLVNIAHLDSPITGQPVAYPAEVGAVADRIFAGDADGRLWKVDVSSTDPSDWEMTLFFDTFPAALNGSAAHGPTDGQPIQTPPILSVDDSGQLTVAVSTGDQDTAGTATDMTNYVWSLSESLATDHKSFLTNVNWYEPMTGGERVEGPISLFNKELYFSTFTPPASTASVCDSGSSRLWGMNYLLPAQTTNLGLGGHADVLTDDAGLPVQFLEFTNLVPTSAGDPTARPTVFGVTIAQQPTCFNDVADIQDDWLGYGSHTAMNDINPGKFELVVQTGQSGQSLGDASTKVFKMELPTPAALSTIDSWAAIVE